MALLSIIKRPIDLTHLLLSSIRNHIENWFDKRIKIQSGYITLDRKTIYVLPTRYGIFFSLVIFSMLIGSINYSNNMGFLLTFLLIGICISAILHTYQNLSHLRFIQGKTHSAFVGEEALFELITDCVNKKESLAIYYGCNKQSNMLTDIISSKKTILNIPVYAKYRGRIYLKKVRLWTYFPLGLFQVWSWINPNMNVIIYPKPSGNHLEFSLANKDLGDVRAINNGNDDYAGMRKYQSGDSPKHIAWKAAAKGHGLFTKQYAGLIANEIWLNWHALNGMDVEQRLSQLCQWVLDAHSKGLRYGLILPDKSIEPDLNEHHKRNCLEALALYNL